MIKHKNMWYFTYLVAFIVPLIFLNVQLLGQSQSTMSQVPDSLQQMHPMMNNGSDHALARKPAANRVGNNGWIAPVWTDTLKNPLAGDIKMSKAGKNLFDSQCFVCHGSRGLGDGVAGMALNPKPANLTSQIVQQQSDGSIFWKMTTGSGLMASYKNIYTDKQRWELVDYIRTLGEK